MDGISRITHNERPATGGCCVAGRTTRRNRARARRASQAQGTPIAARVVRPRHLSVRTETNRPGMPRRCVRQLRPVRIKRRVKHRQKLLRRRRPRQTRVQLRRHLVRRRRRRRTIRNVRQQQRLRIMRRRDARGAAAVRPGGRGAVSRLPARVRPYQCGCAAAVERPVAG